MNDRDLASRLKDVRVPERSADYWEDFPARVRVQVRPERSRRSAPGGFSTRWTWATGLAAACLFFCVTFWPVHLVLKTGMTVRHQLAELPTHLRTFMADEHGLHYLIAEKE